MAYYRQTGRKSFGRKGAYNPIKRVPRFVPPGGVWLPQFEAVFDTAVHGSGHIVVEASAGSGKTTAIVETVYRLRASRPNQSILVLAFNSSIRYELKGRVPEGADIETCHSFNYKPVCRVWGEGKANFDLQTPKGIVAQKLAEAAIGAEPEKRDERDSLMQLMSLCKTRLASTPEQVIEVMDRWGITTNYSREEFAKHVLWMMAETQKRPGTTFQKGKNGKEYAKKAISFDDQVWLPIVNNWAPHKLYDIVLIDEAQDLSPARLQVALRAVKPEGRVIAVGDRFQAIYGFAGADVHALPELIENLEADTLPLTCSFRCAKSIIAEAQEYNPDIEARPDAPEGTIDSITINDILDAAEPGSAILSRTNAPLVSLFFKFAKRGKKVAMLGRDYGAMLNFRISSWARKHDDGPFTGSALLEKNSQHFQEQVAYLTDKGLTTDRAQDEYETINVLAEDLYNPLSSPESVDEILERINNMFSEESKGAKGSDECVTLSSTHKFKGLERDHVYLIADTYKPDAGEEERNLMYVAVTRAKQHLTYVEGKTIKN